MKKVIFIPPILKEVEKPIVLTHRKTNGWQALNSSCSNYQLKIASKIVYLGKCAQDGDMFAVYVNNMIMIFKGALNSGNY